MDHCWLGPNSIMKNLGKGTYLTRDDATKGERKVNGEGEPDTWVKIGDITLTNEDKRIILEGKWLTDKIIHAVQLLMKNDPDLLPVGSLQNSILSQAYAFDIVSGECVQILQCSTRRE